MAANIPEQPKFLPVDKGFAWAVCAGSAVLFFVTMGVTKSLGVMLLEFQDHFGSDPALTSLTVALIAAGFFMFVFFSNTLGMLLGNRTVSLGGAIIAFFSMLITAFSPNIYFVVIFLGLFSGMAYSAMFGPPLVILSAYFKKRRALATGLAVAGGSLGQLSIPLVLNFLIGYYGFQGGMLLFSGILLHAVPAAMLLRPPQWWSRTTSKQQQQQTASCCTRFLGVLKVMLDKELMTSSVFQLLLVSIIFGQMGYFSAVIFLPSAANSFFNNRTLSVILVSLMGICDLVGRMLGGYIADLRVIPINHLIGISLFVPGIGLLVTALLPVVGLIFLSAVLIGAFAGSYSALLTPIIIEYFGLAKVSQGFGILTFLMGFAIAPWPTALAYIFKATRTYRSVLALSGALTALGGFLFFFLKFLVDKRDKKKEAEKAALDPLTEVNANVTSEKAPPSGDQKPNLDGGHVDDVADSMPLTSRVKMDDPEIPESNV